MILAVCLNTAIDKAYIVDNFTPGTVMRVKEVIITAGGKGLNVARILKELKKEVMVTGFVGGYSGDFLENELMQQRIPFKFIKVRDESRTCINIIDKSTNIHTELLEPGPHISQDKINEFFELFTDLVKDCSAVVLSGSAPPGIDTNIYKELISIAKKANKKVLLDSSKNYLAEGLKGLPTLVKPNKSEVEQLLGKKLNDTQDVLDAARELIQMGTTIASISMGDRGVVCASNTVNEAYWAIPPKIQPVNTVGCGDAMVAAFAVGLCENWDLKECTKYAVAVSAAAALSPVTGGIKLDEIERFIEKIEIHQLN